MDGGAKLQDDTVGYTMCFVASYGFGHLGHTIAKDTLD